MDLIDKFERAMAKALEDAPKCISCEKNRYSIIFYISIPTFSHKDKIYNMDVAIDYFEPHKRLRYHVYSYPTKSRSPQKRITYQSALHYFRDCGLYDEFVEELDDSYISKIEENESWKEIINLLLVALKKEGVDVKEKESA